MHYMGADPGDLTPDEMYDRTPIPAKPQADGGDDFDFDLSQSENMGDETVAPDRIQEAA